MPLSSTLSTQQSKFVSDKRWKIHKFGGSSLADADCFRRVAGIVLDLPGERLAVVVSAMGGMTDALIDLAVLAENADDEYRVALGRIGERYAATAKEAGKRHYPAIVSLRRFTAAR